ncbi:DUF378 domain-containing protein [Candidatus Saccharibacteria bacterium]|nr:DUF378 domain-containing protein [Candidatus Saccharibacteria bacterium]
MNAADNVSMLLVLVGGLNWGLIGFFEWNLVGEIFGAGSGAARVVYAIVGLAALYMVVSWFSKMNQKPA